MSKRYFRSEDGAGAAEFALVLPVFLLFVFGLIEFGMLFFTVNQLHWTAERSARCSAVSTECALNGNTTNATVGNYAKSIYKGLAAAQYKYDNTGACSRTGTNSTNSGHRVTANATFKMNLGVYYKSMPLTADACFP